MNRFATVALALLLQVLTPVHGEPSPPKWAVFVPTHATDSAGVSLASQFGVNPRSVCVFRADSPHPKELLLKHAQWVEGAFANAETGLIAATVLLATPMSGNRLHSKYAVIVLDTLGKEVATIRGARSAVWAPDGRRLAVWYSAFEGELVYGDSAGVWDLENHRLQTWESRCVSVGWLTSEVILLNHLADTDAIDLRTGVKSRLARRGAIPSPDTTYALRETHGGPEVWNERLNVDLTDRVESLIDGRDLRFTSRPFWIRDANTPHHLCFSSCRYQNTLTNRNVGPTLCDVYVIDVEEMRAVRTFAGRGIGPTADERGAVTFRGRDVRFIDLKTAEQGGMNRTSFCPGSSVDLSSWKLIDKRRFTLRLPAAFVDIRVQGTDSWIGTFQMPDSSVTLSFDWGRYSAPITRMAPGEQVRFDSCQEMIGGKRAQMLWGPSIGSGPEGDRTARGYLARSVWRDVVPGSDLTLWGSASDWRGLEVLLASFRTIQFK